jgi:hypothetical protein
MRMEAHARVEVATLDALTTLLAEVAIAGAASSNTLVAEAQMVSRYGNRGVSAVSTHETDRAG